jgi:hypothetical protein
MSCSSTSLGYSKLLINQQSEQIQKLEIVRQTEQFHLAQAEDKLLRPPTSDGGALVFELLLKHQHYVPVYHDEYFVNCFQETFVPCVRRHPSTLPSSV